MTVHPAALVLADHQARPHAWPLHNAGVRVSCRCLNWDGWDYDHPAHLAEVLDRAGLLAAGTPPETPTTRVLAERAEVGRSGDLGM